MRRWHSTVVPQVHHHLPFLRFCKLCITSRLTGSAIRPSTAQAQASLHAEQHVSVPTPLCLRPAHHNVSLTELLDWKRQQSSAIADIGNSFLELDGGPSAGDLLRELDWVMDDTIAAYMETPVADAPVVLMESSRPEANGARWQPVRWKQLSAELDYVERSKRDISQWRLMCRATPEELYCLWQQRLQQRAPFQYLISTAHWHTYVLSVGPGILVPRPETEFFADLASEAIQARPDLVDLSWADLGTGSGAIAIATADVLRQHARRTAGGVAAVDGGRPAAAARQPAPCKVWAVDFSPVAVAYARHNVRLAGLQDHVTVARGSWFEPLQHLKGQLGAVVSNPPYIPQEQMQGLQAEVGQHEPWAALEGGDEGGLDSLRVICAGAAEMLAPGGLIALETAGNEQAHAVAALMRALAFEQVAVKDDCYGVPRFVTGFNRQG